MPSYVVDQVLHGWWPMLSTGAPDYGAIHRGAAARRSGVREGLSGVQDAATAESAKSIAKEREDVEKRAAELNDQVEAENQARRDDQKREADRLRDSDNRAAEQQKIDNEKEIADGDYTDLKYEARQLQKDIQEGHYKDYIDPTKKTLLSPTDAKDYKDKLEQINEIMSGVKDIKNLPEFVKTKERNRITRNNDVLERLRKYIPKIEQAVERERVLCNNGPVPVPVENEGASLNLDKLKAELQLAQRRAEAADQAAADCQAMMQDRDEEPCPASVLEAAEKYEGLKQKATEKKEAHTIVSVKTVKAKGKVDKLEVQLAQAMVKAREEYESYTKWELGGWQSYNPRRQRRQKELALANQRVDMLMNQVNDARSEHDQLYITYIQTFTDQEVATALATAAKARADQLKDSVKVVMGKPV
jgi:hypothetical protein